MKSISICITLKKSQATDLYFDSSIYSYLNQDYFNKKIIIIDGSEYPAYKNKIEGYGNQSILKYFHIPDKSSKEGYINAINHVTSDYIMFGTVSDGLIIDNWISSALTKIEDSVAIFGLSKRMNENGEIEGDDNPLLKKQLSCDILRNHLFFISCQYILPELNTVYKTDILRNIINSIEKDDELDLFLNVNTYLINNNFKVSFLNLYANYGRQHRGQLTYQLNHSQIIHNQELIRKKNFSSFLKILFSNSITFINDQNQLIYFKIKFSHKIRLIIFRLFYFRYHSSFPNFGLSNYIKKINSIIKLNV